MQLLLMPSWRTNHRKIWADWQIFCTMAVREQWQSMKKNSRKIPTLMVSCILCFLVSRTTQCSYNCWPNDRSMSTQHKCITSLLSTISYCARLATQLASLATQLRHTGCCWPNAHNMLRPPMLRYVVLKCCDHLARVLTQSTIKPVLILYNYYVMWWKEQYIWYKSIFLS